MPPEFATIQKEVKRTATFIDNRIEGFLKQHPPNDDDYDPNPIVEEVQAAIEGLLLTFDHFQHRLPSRTEQDLNMHDGIIGEIKTLIRNSKDTLIEIGCAEHYLDDWFSGFLDAAQVE